MTKPRLTHVFTPAFIFRHFAANEIVIHLLDLTCDRPGLAAVDGTEINFPQADHLGGSAAHKDFIRNVKLVTRDGLLQHVITQFLRNREDRMACDAPSSLVPRQHSPLPRHNVQE